MLEMMRPEKQKKKKLASIDRCCASTYYWHWLHFSSFIHRINYGVFDIQVKFNNFLCVHHIHQFLCIFFPLSWQNEKCEKISLKNIVFYYFCKFTKSDNFFSSSSTSSINTICRQSYTEKKLKKQIGNQKRELFDALHCSHQVRVLLVSIECLLLFFPYLCSMRVARG